MADEGLTDTQKDELIKSLREKVNSLRNADEDFEAQNAQILDYEAQIAAAKKRASESQVEEGIAKAATKSIKDELNRASEEVIRLQNEVQSLERQLGEKDAAAIVEQEKLEKAQEKIANQDTDIKNLNKDVPGIRADLTAAQQERDAALATIELRDARIQQLESDTAELASQKTITNVLTQQIEQQRTEMMRFNLDPQAFRTTIKDENGVPKAQGKVAGNLEDELLGEKTSSEEEASDTEEETDTETPIPAPPPVPPPAPPPAPPPGPSRIIRIIERIPTYIPYHVSDHSLPFCSVITFVNAWILVSLWCREAWTRVGPTARKLFRIGLPGSQSPPQSPHLSPPPSPPVPPGGNGGNGSGNPPPPPNNNGNSGSIPAANEATPSERHLSEASETGSLLTEEEVMNFQGPDSNVRSGQWSEEGTPQSNQIPHMNVNSDEGGRRSSDDGTQGPDTPRSGSDLSVHLDPVRPPSQDGRERLEPGSAPRRSNTGGSRHSQTPPPAGNGNAAAPGSTVTCLTAEQVEARFPLPDGVSGPVDNYIINAPPAPPPAPPSPPGFWQLVTNPDPAHRPNASRTFRDLLLHILFFYACYMMWVIYLERQNWKEANNIARAFFDDLYQHRCHYGRGILVKVLPEELARGFDWLFLYVGRVFGRELKTYPMPG